MRQLYFDHNATTPADKAVRAAMLPYLGEKFGNPSSVHAMGREARGAIEQAREHVACLIGAAPEEVVFTSGGTEAVNLAILGSLAQCKNGRIISSKIEHPAVLRCCAHLADTGFEVIYLPVDSQGLINTSDLAAALIPDARLVSIMLANNELGTIQPLSDMSPLIKEKGALFHTDAVQAVGKIPVDVADLGVDMLSLSGHKLYGPKGVGALYIKSGIKINPICYGGHHERSLRPGTENVAGIVGLSEACRLAGEKMSQDAKHITGLTNDLWRKLEKRIEGVRLNGHPEKKLPGTLNLSFAGISGESLLMNLDLEGIAVSAGSACSAGSLEPSHVLLALGLSEEQAASSIRISLGRGNTQKEIDTLEDTLTKIVTRLRS